MNVLLRGLSLGGGCGTPCDAGGSVEVQGILRLRIRIRKANRYASLRMTRIIKPVQDEKNLECRLGIVGPYKSAARILT